MPARTRTQAGAALTELPRVVFDDDYLTVYDKPAGMVVESPFVDHDSLLRRLETLRPGLERGGVVHRLDRGTSGLLVVAKTAEAQEGLRELFRRREVFKEYLALVEGVVEGSFEVDAPVRRNRSKAGAGRAAMRADARGKAAVTEGAVERRFDGVTLLRIRIHSGRRHQIRAHLAFIDHPVVGDTDYGGTKGPGRPFLHATRLEFVHPVTGAVLKFESPLPSELTDYLSRVPPAAV